MFTLLFCTVIHFLVDLSGIFFMSAVMMPLARSHTQWLAWAVLYNFMAFAVPALTGYLADRFIKKRNFLLAGIGCALIAAGYLILKGPVPSVVSVGLGNGIFHVGAGKEILLESRGRFAPSGVFISSGALGVFLGNLWGGRFLPLWDLFTVIMILCALFLCVWEILRSRYGEKEPTRSPSGEEGDVPGDRASMRHRAGEAFPSALLLFAVVFIRSYYGSILKYDWKSGVVLSFVFTLCIFAGKLTGGILADHRGLQKTIWISLGISGITAAFSFGSPVLGCISILFFNMTMPLTLSMLAALLPAHQGFAFGLLMLALFLGTLPPMLMGTGWFFTSWGLPLLCFVSLAALLIVTKREGSNASHAD